MSIGSELTAVRERAGLTIEQLSSSTRIRSGLLAAMEADDFSRCGGNFYARGHIRAIARVVKTDPEALLAKFDETHPASQPDRTRREERATSRRPTLHPARPRWAVVLGAILVGLMGWGMVRLFTLPSDVEANASKTSPTPVVTTPAPKPTAKAPIRPTSPVQPAKPATPLRTKLVLTARGDGSYITIRNSKNLKLFQGVLGPGSTQTINYAGEIRVTLENGTNITVFINGTKTTPPSKRFTILPAGKIAVPED
ncbi:helix-turn-helix domain-containing protein [Kribbella sp. CA-293567]|uniref:helix-turn-helix domain-containing protein n=1 Tax=Kribbella sp. CA-293567 TaxID=3002436 RepID=UPI0022DCEE29|nr:RodZ domain-containing protein [Kribbella sp. CA-293567]WBQ02483.1 helix-turn-helix domain-containing protein [Kribbella sp. CA-293567]